MYRLQWSWDLKMCPIREVSSFQRVVCTGFNGVGARRCVPIREVFQWFIDSSNILIYICRCT